MMSGQAQESFLMPSDLQNYRVQKLNLGAYASSKYSHFICWTEMPDAALIPRQITSKISIKETGLINPLFKFSFGTIWDCKHVARKNVSFTITQLFIICFRLYDYLQQSYPMNYTKVWDETLLWLIKVTIKLSILIWISSLQQSKTS